LRPDYCGLQLKEFGGFYFIAFAGYGISFTSIGSTDNKTAIFLLLLTVVPALL
jgi:hypothetical protein